MYTHYLLSSKIVCRRSDVIRFLWFCSRVMKMLQFLHKYHSVVMRSNHDLKTLIKLITQTCLWHNKYILCKANISLVHCAPPSVYHFSNTMVLKALLSTTNFAEVPIWLKHVLCCIILCDWWCWWLNNIFWLRVFCVWNGMHKFSLWYQKSAEINKHLLLALKALISKNRRYSYAVRYRYWRAQNFATFYAATVLYRCTIAVLETPVFTVCIRRLW